MAIPRRRVGTRRIAEEGDTTLGELDYILEEAIVCDYAIVRAAVGDRHGNLVYEASA